MSDAGGFHVAIAIPARRTAATLPGRGAFEPQPA
jgi:hypothetical protein